MSGGQTLVTPAPIRYENGQITLIETDLESSGFGRPWQHQRAYCNQLSHNGDVGQGYNWLVFNQPYVDVEPTTGTVIVVRSTSSSLWFDPSGGGYVARHGEKATLVHDETNHRYVVTLVDGTQQFYHDFTDLDVPAGKFIRQVEPGGAVTEVTAYTDDDLIQQITRSGTVAGQPVTEVYDYVYNEQWRIAQITLRRQVGSSGWENIRRVLYEYYGDSEDFGSEGDLKRARRQVPTSSGWEDGEILYYRYYVSGEANGFLHGLKFVVQPATYARMQADGVNPLTVSNGVLAVYANRFYQYDDRQRATLERIDGGSRTFGLAYTDGTNSSDSNVWKTKTVVIQPDGSEQIVYTNALGQGIVFELKSNGERWITAAHYDGEGRILWFAHPSAVLSYNDSSPTLNIQLRTNAGLIELTEYYTTTGGGAAKGYVSATKLKEGSNGTPVLQASYEYSSHSVGGATVYPVSKQTVYRNDNGTGAIETSEAYTYHSGTVQTQQQTTTLPVVPTTQNGTGVAATRKSYFDLDGRLTWSMDERGFITRRIYDLATGALVRQVDDVDTSLYMDVPSGWTTPVGGGLNLVTDFEADELGRTTQSLGPVHQIDLSGTASNVRTAAWAVYDDVNHIIYSGRGYFVPGTSSDTLINPVSITKRDANGKVREEIQAVAPATSGTLAEIVNSAGGGATAFPQSSYTRWTTYQYTDCCLTASQRAYHAIPASGPGSSGTNYDQTTYGYDAMKRRNRTVTPGGTITDLVFDPRGLTLATYIGTNDDGGTETDPTGGGSNPNNNMVIVTELEYDDGTDGGDGNLTQQTQHVNATETRVTAFDYDWRNRRTVTDGEIDFYEVEVYDNLNHVIQTDHYDTDTSGNLGSRDQSLFDNRERVYRTIRYGVDPTTGIVGNALTDNTWFDASGHVLCSLPAGSFLFSKTVYDSLGRSVVQSAGYNPEANLSSPLGDGSPDSIANDVLLEQLAIVYDDASDVIKMIFKQRYHNASDNQLGDLQNPNTIPKARVTYQAIWQDSIGRTIAAADYGTNGGAVLSRPDTIPARSDTVLLTSHAYNAAGNVSTITDPSGMITRFHFDNRGRETNRIANDEGSSPSSACAASEDVNVTVQTEYDADSNVFKLTAVNSATGDQTTTYVHGTTLADSEIATSILKRQEIYPDSTGASDAIVFAYNRQRQIILATDQGGTVHAYDYDKLGRLTQDRVTALGSGVDGTVRRIATTYEVRGMKATTTSYDHPTVGSGTTLNQCQFGYNDFGQLIVEYQSHNGAVNVTTTPKVQYGYADGSSNTIRPTELIYPNGRELIYGYGSSGGIADKASRIAAIVDDDSTHLCDYSYLGRGTFVVADSPQPQMKWTLVDLADSDDPDTGDIYSGFDRFGRVKDNRWYNYDTDEDIDRIQYGYDRSSNRTWRKNVVARALSAEFDELYTYDGVHRLKDMQRGTLATPPTSLSSTTFSQCWTLDSTGNWHGFREDDNGDGTWDLIQARLANKVNEITNISETAGPSWVTPTYSAAGNMITIPQPAAPAQSYTATYDAWNRLVKFVDTTTSDIVSEYAYDGVRRQIIQKAYTNGTLSETRNQFYTQPSQWQVLEERVSLSTNAERQFVWGQRYIDDCILRDRDTTIGGTSDERLYACQDANWSVDVTVAAAGSVVERFSYSAYGDVDTLSATFQNTQAALGWDVLFGGYQRQDATGIYFARNRRYSPQLGVWPQRDPYSRSEEHNLYQYVLSVPTSYTDPFGLQPAAFPISIDISDIPRNWDYYEFFRCQVPLKECPDSMRVRRDDAPPVETNGCTYPAWNVVTFWVSTTFWWGIPYRNYVTINFVGPCNKHDICYQTCGESHESCDGVFLDGLIAECDALAAWPNAYSRCIGVAQTYYDAVSFGESYWDAAQAEQCKCSVFQP